MNNLDRMKLIKLGVKDLEVAVSAYEKARKENPNTRDKPPKGVRNGNAKLTEDDVISARHERLQNNTSFQKLADKYGVSKHTIQDAVTGKRWAHVVMPEPQKEDA